MQGFPVGDNLCKFIGVTTSSSPLPHMVLYDLGALRVRVAGLAPVGCCTSQITKYNFTAGNCVEFINDVCEKYSDALRNMLLQLKESSRITILYTVICMIRSWKQSTTHPCRVSSLMKVFAKSSIKQ
uniref:Uncharacterized protein n=1 Tax=Physcomitrium patens TaxID=3218 RepID=A0A2K1IDD2_PHYPA|nr:hypothetical protein PHYPA_029436 [Physcomitrium patens]